MLAIDNLFGTAFTGEEGAHTFEISGVGDAGTVALSGNVTGTLLAANNVNVPLTGSIQDGCAVVTLTRECYEVPGRFVLSIYTTEGGKTMCVYCGVGTITNTEGDAVAYPSAAIPDIQQLINDLQTLIGQIPADYSALNQSVTDLKSAFVNATQYTTNYIDGYYVARDGSLVADPDCCVSEMIPIAAMSPRSCAFYFGESNGTKMNLVIYGEDGTFLDYWGGTSGASRSVSNIPTTAKYARMSFKRGYKGKLTSSNGFVYWEANEFNALLTATVGYATKNRNNTNNGAMGSSVVALEQNSIKNPSIVFYGKIGTFDSLKIGVGADATYTEYLEIDSNNITFHVGTSAGSSVPHGLTISEYLSVIINIKPNCDYTIILNTLGGIYTRDMVYPNPWIGNKGSIFAQAGSANTFTTYRLTYSADFNKTKWLFGDSYITNYSDARWPYYVRVWGYDNTLLNGYPGENSNDAFQDFLALIQHGSPKYVVWCMGMNDPDSSAINADWLRCAQNVISICQRRGIEPILATIPNVPNILHTYKNAWIKNDSGCRYIDFAEAVGAESANSTWYTGCLEEGTSRIHPTVDGARLLAVRALTDFPEFMQK